MTAPALRTNEEFKFLDSTHPIYDEMFLTMDKNMRRAEGGDGILDELWRYDWETKFDEPGVDPWRWSRRVVTRKIEVRDVIPITSALRPGEHYARRQDAAIYVNFPRIFEDETVGPLIREAPLPTTSLDFGSMGEVRRKQDIDEPTLAELTYYNTSGIGGDGAQWDSFWAKQIRAALHTGYRWIFAEMPKTAPRFRFQQLRQGLRAFLVGYDARDVPNWFYVDGQLVMAIVRVLMRNPRIEEEGSSRLLGNEMEYGYYLMTRRGFTGFGRTFANGGWFLFAPDKTPITSGSWDNTNGEIPMAPLFYDEHDRLFGRPATTEMGNAAVALMNVGSAADFDAWDSSGSVQAVRGVDDKGFNLFIDKVKGGNRYAPLRNFAIDDDSKQAGAVQDLSTGAIVADVFEKRTNAILRVVDAIKMQEMFGKSSSGLSEQASWIRGSAPRLTLLAGNVETCQNTMLRFLELRNGFSQTRASTTWTRKFQLIELTTAAQAVLQLERIAGISSPTLDSTVIVAAATEEGFIADNATRQTVEDELKASSELKLQQQQAALVQAQQPQVPGDRKRDTPPEPAQTNQPVKDQLDGPEIP